VKANYAGTLLDGTEFDNSYKRGQPLIIPVSGVIRGWTEALEMMPVGSKWKLYIPSDLAYGDRGAGGAIPGGATLIFTIELLEIVNK
jgi:FKBP-type peptidyl-prolyl cis-trans isomerase FklB